MSTIANKYFIKQGADAYADFTTKWVGLTILKIDDFLKKGKAKNIYTASWVNSSTEDVNVPDVVYFEQPDMTLTFKVSDFDNHAVDVNALHDDFITYMTTHRVTIKSLYAHKEADFVCLADYVPTTVHLQRTIGQNYILGTITMHRVSPPVTTLS